MTDERNDRIPGAARVALALAIGTAGGWLAARAGIPLPWMLGSMGACLVAVLLSAPVERPRRVVEPMRMVLGVMLGSTLTPALLEQAQAMLVSVALLVPYVATAALVGWVYFSKVCRLDSETAFFSSMPGGVFTMTAYAEDVGADVRQVALIQSARIILVVSTLPFVIRWLAGGGAFGQSPLLRPDMGGIGAQDAGLLVAAGLVGYVLARAIRAPGAAIVGPMVASAALHLGGVTSVQMPGLFVIAAQVVLGSAIGTRFTGSTPAQIGRTILLSSGFVVAMLALTVTTALIAEALTGIHPFAAVLAYAPGGLTEMSLVALGLGFNVGYVATLHFLRILVIALLAPLFFLLLGAGPISQLSANRVNEREEQKTE
jgi:membrane AbrB-like protein